MNASVEVIRALLDYDTNHGALLWRARVGTSREIRRWNTRYARSIAGSPGKHGYLQIKIAKRLYLAHRVIWIWMTGCWPADQIDHRDRDITNNRWANLRLATGSQNCANRLSSSANSSGVKGVTWHAASKKWAARICIGGKLHVLGYFDNIKPAQDAYVAAAKKHFGEFARVA